MSSYARMRDEGIVPAFSLDHGITMSLYYKDPDGCAIPWPRPKADFTRMCRRGGRAGAKA
jgi:hypothetical protein